MLACMYEMLSLLVMVAMCNIAVRVQGYWMGQCIIRPIMQYPVFHDQEIEIDIVLGMTEINSAMPHVKPVSQFSIFPSCTCIG